MLISLLIRWSSTCSVLLSLPGLHLSMLFLHLLHHFLDSKCLSLIFALDLSFDLLLKIDFVYYSTIGLSKLFELLKSFPEFFEIMVLDQFLSLYQIQLEFFNIKFKDSLIFLSCNLIFNVTSNFCTQIFNVNQNIVFLLFAVSCELNSCWLLCGILTPLWKRSINLNIDELILACSFILCSILDIQYYFF